MGNMSRYISAKATKVLISKAGSRCSYNRDGVFCNKLTIIGSTVTGEMAHIVGVRGPRANEQIEYDKNSYENLIWLCPEHHKVIDNPANIETYSVKFLLEMKDRHERLIEKGYPPHSSEQAIHDYSVLSTFFQFINIHTLYTHVAYYPSVNVDFFDVYYMYDAMLKDFPEAVPLRDLVLNEAFYKFIEAHEELASYLRETATLAEDEFNRVHIWIETPSGKILTRNYLLSVDRLIDLVHKRFPMVMHQQMFNPFPNSSL